jgi:hypothetical protein
VADESATGSANIFGPTRNTTAREAVVLVGGETPARLFSPDTDEK